MTRFNLTKSIYFALVIFNVISFSHAQAQTNHRSFGFSAPLTLIGNEIGGKFEFNLNSEASLALEGIYVSKGEEYSEEKQKEEKLSLVSNGYEIATSISRFTEAQNMAGFYWTLGAGYRQLDATWSRPPQSSALNLNQSTYEYDEDGRLQHHMLVSGHTLRGRLGYRFVPQSLPFLLGAYFGIRHFENKFKDVEDEKNAPTSEEEKVQLRRMIMTRPEAGIDVGLVF